jgi:class 3 adenylate cyclase
VIISKGEGDSFFAVFPSAVAAVEAAGECQMRLGREHSPTGVGLRVRMGLHTGEARVLAVIMLCMRRLIAALGCGPLAMAARCC